MLDKVLEATSIEESRALHDRLHHPQGSNIYVLVIIGAVNAMQDAAILASCLYDLESRRRKDIIATFQDYKEQRYKHVKHHFDSSTIQGRVLFGQVCRLSLAHNCSKREARQGVIIVLTIRFF